MFDAPDEAARLLTVDPRAECLRLLPQHPLIARNGSQARNNGGWRHQSVADQHVLEQHQVVVLAENAVERLEPALIGEQPVAAAALEQADVEPMVLHMPPPGVIVRAGRTVPGGEHRFPRPPEAGLETW